MICARLLLGETPGPSETHAAVKTLRREHPLVGSSLGQLDLEFVWWWNLAMRWLAPNPNHWDSPLFQAVIGTQVEGGELHGSWPDSIALRHPGGRMHVTAVFYAVTELPPYRWSPLANPW